MDFITQVLNGLKSPKDVGDFIDEWHNEAALDRDLYDYLGFTWKEYQRWLDNSDSLNDIIEDRRR